MQQLICLFTSIRLFLFQLNMLKRKRDVQGCLKESQIPRASLESALTCKTETVYANRFLWTIYITYTWLYLLQSEVSVLLRDTKRFFDCGYSIQSPSNDFQYISSTPVHTCTCTHMSVHICLYTYVCTHMSVHICLCTPTTFSFELSNQIAER